jgi:hypothetical protein
MLPISAPAVDHSPSSQTETECHDFSRLSWPSLPSSKALGVSGLPSSLCACKQSSPRVLLKEGPLVHRDASTEGCTVLDQSMGKALQDKGPSGNSSRGSHHWLGQAVPIRAVLLFLVSSLGRDNRTTLLEGQRAGGPSEAELPPQVCKLNQQQK